MSEFARSLRALENDSGRMVKIGLGVAAGLLALWSAWFFGARVGVRAVSVSARVEVGRASHRVDALVRGRIIDSRLVVGRSVEAGEVLVELDAEPERVALAAQQARIPTLQRQLDRLQAEVSAKRQALDEAGQEARAATEEATALAQLADSQASRVQRLHVRGLVSDAERERARSEAQNREAAVRRTVLEERRTGSDRRGALEEVLRRAAEIQGDMVSARAEISRLERAIERHRIRAPIAGRLAEVADVPLGSVIEEGQVLGRLIPVGTMRVVAEFSPSAALGRIQPFQKARMRLEGFPWAEYGSVPLRVMSVAGETRDNRVRVELDLDGAHAQVPLQHGLPGLVEVEIERVSPAVLLLRTTGRLLDSPRAVASVRSGG